jgi:hypothetical protein
VLQGVEVVHVGLIFFRLAPPEKLEDAYHVNMVVYGTLLGALSFISFISVDLI